MHHLTLEGSGKLSRFKDRIEAPLKEQERIRKERGKKRRKIMESRFRMHLFD